MLTKDGKFDQTKFLRYIREEGVNPNKIARVVRSQFGRVYDLQQLIEQFKKEDDSNLNLKKSGVFNFKSDNSLEQVQKKQLKNKKKKILSKRQAVKKLNRKSQLYVSD